MSEETTLEQPGTTEATPTDPGTTLLTGAAPENTATPEGETKPDETKKEEPTSAEAKPEAKVPEHYEITPPEGETLDSAALSVFEPVFQKYNLSNEAVQELVDLQSHQRAEALTALNNQWLSELKADPVIGGANLDENIKLGQSSLAKYGTPALVAFLDGSKLGNHPEMVRYFANIGRAMAEPKIVGGSNTTTPTAKSFYNKSNMN